MRRAFESAWFTRPVTLGRDDELPIDAIVDYMVEYIHKLGFRLTTDKELSFDD
jgi:hypothetical protein